MIPEGNLLKKLIVSVKKSSSNSAGKREQVGMVN